MDGWWDCEALDEMFFRAFRERIDEKVPFNFRALLAFTAAALLNLQTKRRAAHLARHHYDLGNDFFKAMLDSNMQYSCGYFDGAANLDEAQEQKLALICQKLGLQPGMRLLDIGCGWGGLAKFAATHYGCKVVGITLSKEQQAYGAQLCRGLPVEIRRQDYRDVAGSFDRIVSVGMIEHVGYKNYPRYMKIAFRCLRDDGLFLCHTIGNPKSCIHSDLWINRYIFPNSMLPSVAQIAQASEKYFVIEDLHNFGAYYDPTLCAWEKNFRDTWPRFEKQYGKRFYRMWRYYLLSCAAAFRARSIELYQFVFSKKGILGGYVRPLLKGI